MPNETLETNHIKYLKQKLSELASKFPSVTFKYAFDNSIQTHIVEITPEAEYYHNNALDKAWMPVSLEFMRLFDSETITFISSDSILAIENPEIVFNGLLNVQDEAMIN